MTKKGPLDASLETLRHNVMVSHSWVKKDYEAAIRVLEAAGRVDKGALTTYGASSVLDDILVELTLPFSADRHRFMARYTRGEKDFRAFIESLPEPEEERK